MAKAKGKLKVFLCHASENKPIIQDLFDRLTDSGFEPWLDSEVLLAGMDWDLEIKKGMRASDAVIVCLSKVSVAKEGYIQKEIKFAQDFQDEKPRGTIFLIPLNLEKSKTPFDLQDIQWGDYTAPDGYERLVRALNMRAHQMKKELGNHKPLEEKSSLSSKPSQQTENIQLILDGEFSEFNKEKQEDIIGVLSALLHVEKNSIRVLRISPGSIVLELELSLAAANRLLKLFENNDFRLKSMGLISVKILGANSDKARKISEKKLVNQKKNISPINTGSVNITIHGNVVDSNLVTGNNNQASNKSSISPSKTSPPSYTDEIPPVGDLPLGSYLPFSPNPLFTGRVDDLRKLADALVNHAQTGTVITQAVTGMGGLGKTQLAVEFAYRYGKYFQGVHWLNLADPTTLDSEIALCGGKMGLDNWPDDQPSQVTMTELTWKSQGPRLLILDNFEDVPQANHVLSRLRHSNIRLLVTSRHSNWPATTGLSSIPLELFSEEESLKFLKESMKKRKDKDDELNTLSERLGYLPLALELASRYSNDHPRLSVSAYLEQAKEALEHPSMNAWRKDILGLTPTQHDTSLLGTFALSWLALSAVEGKDEIAQKVFQMAGYLAPNTAIPLEIFEKVLEISSEICDENLTMLYGLGLLRESESQPTIHPLLAEYARGLSKENSKIVETLADTLVTLSKAATDTGLPTRFEPFKPHISVLAMYAENEKIDSAGTLWNNYGFHLDEVADYSGARTAYERAIKISEASFGPDHPGVAIRVNNLGTVLYHLGDLDGARRAFERALRIDEASFASDHPNVATDVNNLGMVMKDQGDLEGARTMFERALKIGEVSFGPDHPKVAIRVNNLGLVMYALGDLEGARTMFGRALKIDEVAFGPDHPNVATGFNNLGLVMKAQGDLVGGGAAYERAIKIWEATLGTEHPQVALGVNNLGLVMKAQGDLDGARAAFERALKIWKKFLLPDHPNIKGAQRNLDSLESKT